MTTKQSSVPVYQLHKASGQARVKINGHDHYLGPFETPASEQARNRLLAQYYQHGRLCRRTMPTRSDLG